MKHIITLFLLLTSLPALRAQTDLSHPMIKEAPMPSPLPSPPFPGSDWAGGPVIGVSAEAPDYALQKALGLARRKSRVKIYGWVEPSYNYSTSQKLNVPATYYIVPNAFELNQLVLRIERQPDLTQSQHFDWGFRLSNLYGMDYRYTYSEGWFGNQYIRQNNLYGYDPVECYVMLFFPKVAGGMLLRVGRYLSPPDIESQFATDNYLFSHSVMFTYDPFTFTGVQATIRLSRRWQIACAAQGGNDMAVWSKQSRVNGQAFIRWVAASNNNSIWTGINSLGPDWKYTGGQDDMQMVSGVWGHKFSDRVHMMTEAYYTWERNAAAGGSASYGPLQYGAGDGPGPIIPGISSAIGAVNYVAIALGSKSKNYMTVRNDYLNDKNGWRSGYATTYTSHTLGVAHLFSNWLTVRPEIRYDRNWNTGGTEITPYDRGTKANQLVAAADVVLRF